MSATIEENLAAVKARIAAEAEAFGRDPAAVRLVAVSKTHPAETVAEALNAGHRRFGENRVQEAAAKWPGLRARYPGIELHLIGPLQSNKAREAIALFDAIETLDRPKLAETFVRLRDEGLALPRLLVQINTGCEPQKAGVLPSEADAFLDRCKTEWNLPVAGLMCIPPVEQEPSPHFALLRKIAERHGLPELSMGMSDDYPIAVTLGATLVRVGSAIFGARAYPAAG
ncbi:YggS family pyridoxal phosphate-dependent enzyme [Oleispirillum naphthae]|uniref:YggS family pyridoxal phosphate-dependent enzyme n=1 Tax=Oleispirillum naphthae TaxID=2838853 RepID=UPI00308232AE